MSPEKVLDTVTALYNTFFVERKPIHTPEGILAVLEKTIGGAEAKAVLEKVQNNIDICSLGTIITDV